MCWRNKVDFITGLFTFWLILVLWTCSGGRSMRFVYSVFWSRLFKSRFISWQRIRLHLFFLSPHQLPRISASRGERNSLPLNSWSLLYSPLLLQILPINPSCQRIDQPQPLVLGYLFFMLIFFNRFDESLQLIQFVTHQCTCTKFHQGHGIYFS